MLRGGWRPVIENVAPLRGAGGGLLQQRRHLLLPQDRARRQDDVPHRRQPLQFSVATRPHSFAFLLLIPFFLSKIRKYEFVSEYEQGLWGLTILPGADADGHALPDHRVRDLS